MNKVLQHTIMQSRIEEMISHVSVLLKHYMLASLALCVLLLAGCQQATTMVPAATQAELQRERGTQAELAKNAETFAPESIDQRDVADKLNRVADKVQPAALALCRDMFGPKTLCAFDIVLAEEGGLNAFADGEKVVMFPEMIAFTRNDEELALVLAHELAHNIMRHPDSQRQNVTLGALLGTVADQIATSQGFNTGGMLSRLGSTGAMLRYTPGFEREADYTGLYILARSGYAIENTPEFWRRMSQQNPDSIYIGTTHPTNPERYITLEKTINEIQSKRQAGLPLLPERNPQG